MPGGQPQLFPKGASRAPGDTLDGGGYRLTGGHRECEEFRTVGHGGVNRALSGVCTHGEEAVHAGNPKEGADERAGAQGNEGGAQGGGVARGNEHACGDEACYPRDRLAQPEDGHVRVHTGQGEPTGHGFAGGSERVEGRGTHAARPRGDCGGRALLHAPLRDAVSEGGAAREDGDQDEDEASTGDEGDSQVESSQCPRIHRTPPRFLGSTLRRPMAFMIR